MHDLDQNWGGEITQSAFIERMSRDLQTTVSPKELEHAMQQYALSSFYRARGYFF
jgi:hypothetical protein